MNARSPFFEILYNGKDISRDVSSYVVEISYDDNIEGKSDEISIRFDDTKGLWRGAWYPEKGDTLEVAIGYPNLIVECGTFEIEELEFSGKPDQLTLRAIAAVPTKELRSKKSFVHENKTLDEIVKTIAQKNGLEVIGTIEEIRIGRITQNRESDLAFLMRLGKSFGYLFSVRGTKLTFTSVYELDARTPVTRVRLEQMSRYSFQDKMIGTYKEAEIAYHNVESRETVQVVLEQKELNNQSIREYLLLREKAENKQQAEAIAKAKLREANTKGTTAEISVEGNPLLVAGNNVDLAGVGAVSGVYQITKSSHKISITSYTTDISCKRINVTEEE